MKCKNSINLVILFSLFISNSLFSQSNSPTLKYFYTLTYQANIDDKNSLETEKMILYANNSQSKYASKNHLLYEDSLKWVLVDAFQRTGKIDGSVSIPQTFFKSEIYKTPNSIEIYENILSQTHFYEMDRNAVSWNISTESSNINGYNCQKALGKYGGREYIAWFTTEIPVSDGPYIFCNLPGLIVKVHDTQNHYNWELTGVEKKSQYDLNTRPEDYIESSNRDVLKMKLLQVQNPGLYLDQLGSFSDEHRRMYIEKYSRRNNPIEVE